MDRATTLRADGLETPHPSRFSPERDDYEAALSAHTEAVAAGRPGYLDPETGLYVMTSVDLAERGWCCDRGCRHCPFVDAAGQSGPAPGSQQNEDLS